MLSNLFKTLVILIMFLIGCLGSDQNNDNIDSEISSIYYQISPNLNEEKPFGCNTFIVLKRNQKKDEELVVSGNISSLGFNLPNETDGNLNNIQDTQTKTFILEDNSNLIHIERHIRPDESYGDFMTCGGDIIPENYKESLSWQALSGQVTISIFGFDNTSAQLPYTPYGYFFVTVTIENVYLYDENGKNEIFIDKFIFENVEVGAIWGA